MEFWSLLTISYEFWAIPLTTHIINNIDSLSDDDFMLFEVSICDSTEKWISWRSNLIFILLIVLTNPNSYYKLVIDTMHGHIIIQDLLYVLQYIKM